MDILSGFELVETPEELVRQSFIEVLHDNYGYPYTHMRREVGIQSGSKEIKDANGNPIRADIVVYNSEEAALKYDQGNMLFIVECKQPNREDGYAQLVSYIYNTSAIGGIWTNGEGMDVYRKDTEEDGSLEKIQDVPPYPEKWSGNEVRLKKEELKHPHNIRFILSTCHNKLYGRGMENEDYDLTMDMVRILLAKIQDETEVGKYPKFWISKTELEHEQSRKEAAKRIQGLFRKYADSYPDVFDKNERITVGDDCIVEAVGVLQHWALAARDDNADDWDLMGETYEQFTHANLKRQRGQFFTNRLVINMMVQILDPKVGESALDPAGGGGGFATAIFRHLRRQVIAQTKPNTAQRERLMTAIKNSVFLVEIAARLVKIAKCAMLLTGDGQSGMTRGNSIDEYDRLDSWIKSRCNPKTSTAPNIIATNPPFAGQKAESQISDPKILKLFAFGHVFKENEDGGWCFWDENNDDQPAEVNELAARQAPELLFLERCVDWVQPGGRIGIVLPKGVLDGISYAPYRWWLLNKCEVRAVITLHKDTFQPDTGVRTCVLILHKPNAAPRNDYPIFMAQSQRIGQDSKGNPVYELDGNALPTGVLNEDLTRIASEYTEWNKTGQFTESEFRFLVQRKDLDDALNLNPQHYGPKLNKAMEDILSYNEKPGWGVTTLGQIEPGIKIYLGPRWNASNIKTDYLETGTNSKPFLTANAAFETRRLSMKWLNLDKASKAQLKAIEQLAVEEGDILVTRSGTIGKVTYATQDLAENYIISDDLIRIRVEDPTLRAYLLAYLTSEKALLLMKRDEYGSVQQHLQPRHLQDLLVPVPDDWKDAAKVVQAGQQLIKALDLMADADSVLRSNSL